MHPQGQSIDRVVELDPSVCLLLALLGCVIALTGMADRPLAQAPVSSADAHMLTEATLLSPAVTYPAGPRTAPGRDSMSIANRDYEQPQDGFAAQPAATTPSVVDRSRDRRVDLMDMATSIRWHRSAASDLPPGSD